MKHEIVRFSFNIVPSYFPCRNLPHRILALAKCPSFHQLQRRSYTSGSQKMSLSRCFVKGVEPHDVFERFGRQQESHWPMTVQPKSGCKEESSMLAEIRTNSAELSCSQQTANREQLVVTIIRFYSHSARFAVLSVLRFSTFHF